MGSRSLIIHSLHEANVVGAFVKIINDLKSIYFNKQGLNSILASNEYFSQVLFGRVSQI